MQKGQRSKYYLASIVGNVLEWYDFVLYGMFATVFSKIFFSTHNPQSAILATLGIFAVGYLMRPIGGLFIGHFGDTRSRKRALIFSLSLMGIATTLIGVLPSYDSIGVWASVLLVALRLIQGFAVGGEFPGSMVVLRDIASRRTPAFATSLSVTGAMGGFLIGSGVATLLVHNMSSQAFHAWGWRLPFLAGFILAILGLYVRMKVMRDDDFVKQRRVPIVQLFRHYKKSMLVAMSQVFLVAVFSSIGAIFLVTYLNHYLGYPLDKTLFLLFISTLIQMGVLPLSAYITDVFNIHLGWSKLGCVVIALTMYPLFIMMQKGGADTIIAVILFMIIFSLAIGQTVYMIVECFPKPVRYSGVAFCHGLIMSLTVGLTPLAMNGLLIKFGLAAPAYVLIFAAVLAFVGLLNFNRA
jgi:MHS family proline/betaine transporter-like MFS transporter